MSDLEYGSVVWVRLGQAWWPGTITTMAKCPPEFVEGLRKMPVAVVKFFHENEFQDVHKSEHIFPYSCDRKEEFIRRGQYINKNQSHGDVDLLNKFEADVVTAEKLTGGDMNILETLGEVADSPTNPCSPELDYSADPQSTHVERPQGCLPGEIIIGEPEGPTQIESNSSKMRSPHSNSKQQVVLGKQTVLEASDDSDCYIEEEVETNVTSHEDTQAVDEYEKEKSKLMYSDTPERTFETPQTGILLSDSHKSGQAAAQGIYFQSRDGKTEQFDEGVRIDSPPDHIDSNSKSREISYNTPQDYSFIHKNTNSNLSLGERQQMTTVNDVKSNRQKVENLHEYSLVNLPQSPEIIEEKIVSESPEVIELESAPQSPEVMGEEEIVPQFPEMEEESLPQSPEMEEESVPQSPESNEEETLPHSLEIEEEIVAQSPEIEEEIIPQSPEIEEETVAQSPEIEEETVAQAPEIEEETVAQSPEIEEEAISQSSESSEEERMTVREIEEERMAVKEVEEERMAVKEIEEERMAVKEIEEETVAQSPATEEEIVTQSPEIVEETMAQSPEIVEETMPQSPEIEETMPQSPESSEEETVTSPEMEVETVPQSQDVIKQKPEDLYENNGDVCKQQESLGHTIAREQVNITKDLDPSVSSMAQTDSVVRNVAESAIKIPAQSNHSDEVSSVKEVPHQSDSEQIVTSSSMDDDLYDNQDECMDDLSGSAPSEHPKLGNRPKGEKTEGLLIVNKRFITLEEEEEESPAVQTNVEADSSLCESMEEADSSFSDSEKKKKVVESVSKKKTSKSGNEVEPVVPKRKREPSLKRSKKMKVKEKEPEEEVADDDYELPDLSLVTATTAQKRDRLEAGDLVWVKYRKDWWPSYIKNVYLRQRKFSIYFIACDQNSGIRVSSGSVKKLDVGDVPSYVNQNQEGFSSALHLCKLFCKLQDRGNEISAHDFFSLSPEDQLALINPRKSPKSKSPKKKVKVKSEKKTTAKVKSVKKTPARATPTQSYLMDIDEKLQLSARERGKLQSALKARKADNQKLVKFIKSAKCLDHLWKIFNGDIPCSRHSDYQDLELRKGLLWTGIGPFQLDKDDDQIMSVIEDLKDEIKKKRPDFSNGSDYAFRVWMPEAIKEALRVVKKVPVNKLDEALEKGYMETAIEKKARRLTF